MKKRMLSVVLVVALVMTAVVCVSFVAHYAHHDCTGAKCAVCAALRLMDWISRPMYGGKSQMLFFLLFAALFFVTADQTMADAFEITPIGRKVRLND